MVVVGPGLPQLVEAVVLLVVVGLPQLVEEVELLLVEVGGGGCPTYWRR